MPSYAEHATTNMYYKFKACTGLRLGTGDGLL